MTVWRERLARATAQRAARGLQRRLRTVSDPTDGELTVDGARVLDLCSNDYLGLARDPEIIEAAREALGRHGCGARASRLLTGNYDLLEQTEAELATFKGTEAALIFPSGYQANLGLIATVVAPGDAVFVDRLAHACLVDGVRLSGVRLRVFPHNELDRLEGLLERSRDAPARWILVDAVYSMDGDLAPLPRLLEIAARHDATIILDDAHGTGVVGATGRGTTEHFAIDPRRHADRLIIMATMSKALGAQGGAVLGPRDLRDALVNSARPFVYSTGISPAPVAATLAAIRILCRDPSRVAQLQQKAKRTLAEIQSHGLDTMGSVTPIIPIVMGDAGRALAASEELRQRGILVLPIRPPTVPRGTSRLRLTVSSVHSDERLLAACGEIAGICRSLLSSQQ